MQSMSTAYNTQIHQKIRTPSYIKILFTVTDPQALDDSYTEDNGHMYWSDSSKITGTDDVTENYMLVEHNRAILDGASRLPIPDGEVQIYQGYTGNEVSDEDGYWTVNPIVSVNFLTTYFQFAGLSMTFDSIFGDYPAQFNVKMYKDDVLVQTIPCTPTNYELNVFQAIDECNRIDFEAVQSHYPMRRFRMEHILLGVKRTFTEKDITSATWNRELDLINSKLPKNEFNFTIIDKDREYDPENVSGIYAYMESKQECSIEIGYELNDGTIEWTPISTLFTTGDLKISTEATIPTVDFKTQGTLAFLTRTYQKGIYYVGGRTLYDLAEDVLLGTTIPLGEEGNHRWYIDPVLDNYTCYVPLDTLKFNVLLQQIANAGMCTIDIDRSGFITIKPKDDTPQDFTFGLGDIMSPPTTSKYPVLQGVDTYYNTVSVATSAEELGKYDISGAASTIYQLSYDMATDIEAVAGAGLTIEGTPTYYAQMCEITLTGTGTLTINGKKITTSQTAVSVEYNSTGERCPIENPLITAPAHATAYATWVGDYVNRRIEYELKDRGFPELDSGDSIGLNTLYTDDIDVDVIAMEISFKGAISGTTKVLKK